MSWKSGSVNLLEPSGPPRACYGTPLTFTGTGSFGVFLATRPKAELLVLPAYMYIHQSLKTASVRVACEKNPSRQLRRGEVNSTP